MVARDTVTDGFNIGATTPASGYGLCESCDGRARSMSGNWGSVLTELIPLALVVALSPLSIIPAVLVCTRRGPDRPGWRSWPAGWSGWRR